MQVVIIWAGQVILFAIAIAACTGWTRHGGPTRRDIAGNLMLLALVGLSILVAPWMPTPSVPPIHLALALMMLHPYTLAVLSDHLVMIPRRVRTGIGFGALTGIGILALSPVLPSFQTQAQIIASMFVVVTEAYLASVFLLAADVAGGITRRRLRIAALAPILVAVAGVAPATHGLFGDAVLPFVHLAVMFAAVATLLGFAPPRALRRHWRLMALEGHMEHSIDLPLSRGVWPIARHLLGAAVEATGASRAHLLLRPTEDDHFVLVEDAADLTAVSRLDGSIGKAWSTGRPVLVDPRDGIPDPEDVALMERMRAKAFLVVPVRSRRERWGLLMVTYRWSPLFPDEDIETLSLLGRHCATLLDQVRVRDQQCDLIDELRVNSLALERSNEDLGAFSYAVSHDLRTPLITEMWILDELREMLGPAARHPAVNDHLDRLQQSIDGMWSMTSDLLELAQVPMDPTEEVTVDLQALVDEVIEEVKGAHPEKAIRIELGPDRLPCVMGDGTRYRQIFRNLIGNAVKYGSEKSPRVRIEVDEEFSSDTIVPGGGLMVVVSDDGPGVPPEYREKVFDVCFRAPDPLDRKIPGSGIGLAIARKVAQAYDGTLRVEEADGGGAAFVLRLPLHRVVRHGHDPRGEAWENARYPSWSEGKRHARKDVTASIREEGDAPGVGHVTEP